ncbi:hypothetical protein [Algibacter lectus]|uniref:Outer membrane protein beta-barrel domain-containing protein n=1 Tax=Algibacter lectus TaxID=221126 RepID=A0A090X2F2_9FLAO|nr:hypothetical protein [Algibacter lectus]MDO7138966.1 hypothetical protein [Algibacter lectus]MWW26793.1 hypothetical protein [Algibacter lectus]TDY65366.1 hypothetical protein DFQ06_0186 [Algibacter lectus]SFD71184.1 hypothetical protein SAMN04489722_1177 [Algibacter lectus]GAL65045.1 hypothetical protein JCM19300_2247 [Algibacter lectus]
MKKILLVAVLLGFNSVFAQEDVEITSDNSWLKAGIITGIPVGDASDVSSYSLGLDLRGQYLINPNIAIGVASGYNHFFGKDNIDDFGVIPAAGFFRYYFTPNGLFLGTDVGYGFLTNVENNDGGLYVNPQIGYHNKDWNFYAYYQNTFAEYDVDVQNVGVGVTYNIRFK